MKVTVKFFSSHRKIVGSDEITMEIHEGITIKEFMDLLEGDYPGLVNLKAFTMVSLNHKIVEDTWIIEENDEIALFPPVAGG